MRHLFLYPQRHPQYMGDIDREYWKAFENYDSLKFNFVARKAFKDLPAISADVETDVLTGTVSARGQKGYITYKFEIKPTNGKKFKVHYDITAKLGEMLPKSLPEKIRMQLITSNVIEKKLQQILPNTKCEPYVEHRSGRMRLAEAILQGNTAAITNTANWLIVCHPNTEDEYYKTTTSFQEGAKEITQAIQQIEKAVDPEAIFYKAWNTWRELNIYMSKEEAEKKMNELTQKYEE